MRRVRFLEEVRMSTRRLNQIALAWLLGYLTITLGGCAPVTEGEVRPVPALVNAYVIEVPIEAGADATFDAAMRVGLAINLTVASIDRAAGLINFEPATLDVDQLEEYCLYPLLHPVTLAEWETFSQWQRRTDMRVSGEVIYAILVTPTPKGSTLAIRTRWFASNGRDTYLCNSTGVSEDDFAAAVARLVR
jgi:hypothetical protein